MVAPPPPPTHTQHVRRPLTTPTRVAFPLAEVRAPVAVTSVANFPPRVPAGAAAVTAVTVEPVPLRIRELTKISTTLSRLNRARRASDSMTLGGKPGWDRID